MTYPRKIPRKLVINGDKRIGQEYISLADKELLQLETEMKFQGLKQYARTRRFGDVVIQCWAGFGLAQVAITVGRGGASVEKQRRRECFCLPCFTFGYVQAVVYLDPCSYYDVEVCQKTQERADQIGSYELLSNVVSLDYAIYEEGQPVLVSLVPCTGPSLCGCEGAYPMCTITEAEEVPCLLAIVPIHIEDVEGAYLSVPKWKEVDRRWEALYY